MLDIAYNKSEVIDFGELRKYKIGEIAKIAGVSKRTIDYYTNLGLLNPIRSASNYRYYADESLTRLKVIEGMKEQRRTLGEIREKLVILDGSMPGEDLNIKKGTVDIEFIKGQLKQLESQLTRLQPAVENLDAGQAVLSKQIIMQSIALMQTLIIYI